MGAFNNDWGGIDAGGAYVYSGQTGAVLWTFTCEASGDQFGGSVSGAGNTDNDGYADLIVGAYYNDTGGTEAGRAHVYSLADPDADGLGDACDCACDCHADPQCDAVTNVLDVVHAVNVAFRGAEDITDPNASCPRTTTDVDCSGFTNVLDVVHVVNVAFRGGDPAVEFCDPCAP